MVQRIILGGVLTVAVIILARWALQNARAFGDNAVPTTRPSGNTNVKTEKATFAAGCFWGVETAFRKVDGVVSTRVGYIGGQTQDPTYKQVCTDETGHAEAVEVTYDPTKVSYGELLDTFWTAHDPTTLDRQGPDVGTQYRSAIFFYDPAQQKIANDSKAEVDGSHVFRGKVVTQIVPAGKFYTAEEYHQQYFEKQGTAESCHTGVSTVHTKLAKDAAAARIEADKSAAACDPNDPNASCGTSHWKALTDAELRAKLTPEQYAIARQAGTERAFTGKYWNDHRPGVYHCAVCGQELFDAKTKFESGTGWPSFYQPLTAGAMIEKTDGSHGMERTEVLCSQCLSHLGHAFNDGPAPTGKRYCMNSAVLDLAVNAKPMTQPAAGLK